MTDVAKAKDVETTDAEQTRRSSHCYAPVQVECWKTEDGKLFESQASAEHHQGTLNEAKIANEVFESGASVADSLRAVEFAGDIDPVLERVTKETQLVISHWQCQDTPGYKPVYFEPGLSMYVSGHAGSWSGPCGSSVGLQDLVRYAKDNRTVFGA